MLLFYHNTKQCQSRRRLLRLKIVGYRQTLHFIGWNISEWLPVVIVHMMWFVSHGNISTFFFSFFTFLGRDGWNTFSLTNSHKEKPFGVKLVNKEVRQFVQLINPFTHSLLRNSSYWKALSLELHTVTCPKLFWCHKSKMLIHKDFFFFFWPLYITVIHNWLYIMILKVVKLLYVYHVCEVSYWVHLLSSYPYLKNVHLNMCAYL